MKTAAIMKIVRLDMINYPPHAFKKGAGDWLGNWKLHTPAAKISAQSLGENYESHSQKVINSFIIKTAVSLGVRRLRSREVFR